MNGLKAVFSLRRSDAFTLDLDLLIEPGETVALLGPNGAGKSTAQAAVAGLLAIDSGSIVLDGRVLDEPSTRTFVAPEDRKIGVVFQDYLLFPHLSVEENVAFGVQARNGDRREALGLARQWLERFGLGSQGRLRPAELSGGQSQRVALARALITDPDLVLLDEPLAALDVSTRGAMRRQLADDLDRLGVPRLLITHDPTDAFLLADRVLIIEEGSIVQAGTAEDIRLRPRSRYAADLAGSNFLVGVASDGVARVGDHEIHLAEVVPDGPVILSIHPTAVSVHSTRPDGSPRNAWQTTVERVESLGARARLLTSGPLPIAVEVTESSRSELGIEPGSTVWLAVKATEIGVQSEAVSSGGRPPDPRWLRD